MNMGNDLSEKKQLTEQLLTAVAERDLRVVRKSLFRGAWLNGYDNCTPLGLALEKKDRAMANFLINQGADVSKPHKGISPLIHAIYAKDDEIVERLVLKGADPNEAFAEKAPWNLTQIVIKTPLMVAIEVGAYDVAKVLLERGANPLKHMWQNENAFVTVQEYNRGDEWIRLLKSKIKSPVTSQQVEQIKFMVDKMRNSNERG